MTKQQRLVLVISILASLVTFLDGSIVTVALPKMAAELGGGLVTQQWVVDAYLITLSALILIAGSLSDIFGRKKILHAGLLWFGVTSLLCAIAPTSPFLIISRGLQGIAGALLVPSSLALIIATFREAAQAKAIGSWTAWTGIAFLIGPLLGGSLVDLASWRLIFAINVVPIALTIWLLTRLEHNDKRQDRAVDYRGAVLCILGFGLPVYALIEQATYGWSDARIILGLAVGLSALAIFLWHEKRTANPMLPLELFTVRNFAAGNLATVAIYAGLSVATFLITVFLQQVGHFAATRAGMAMLPVTIIMFGLSSRFGALAGKFGPRVFMTLGPLVAGIGFLTMLRVDAPLSYWSELFPGVVIFGLGLSMTVAPLTAAVLGSISDSQAGIGSAINNAVARVAGLVAIAALALVIGTTIDYRGFRHGVVAMAVLLIAGGLISFAGIRNVQVGQNLN